MATCWDERNLNNKSTLPTKQTPTHLRPCISKFQPHPNSLPQHREKARRSVGLWLAVVLEPLPQPSRFKRFRLTGQMSVNAAQLLLS